jgi:hypothetical protein
LWKTFKEKICGKNFWKGFRGKLLWIKLVDIFIIG